MVKILTRLTAPAHDPIYGIRHPNIAKKLTPKNWQKKAIVRNGLYIWVVRGQQKSKDCKRWRYFVRIHSDVSMTNLQKDFSRRDRALAYANDLGAEVGSYPTERESRTYITMFPGLGTGPVTFEI